MKGMWKDMMKYSIFWNESIAQLLSEKKIEKMDHETWFSKIKYEEDQDGEIAISAPSEFIKDRFSENFKVMIEERLERLTGETITLNISVKRTRKKENKVEKEKKSIEIVTEKKKHPQLKEDYVFDRFVIGPNSAFAANAAKAIASDPGKEYNPFLIYGGVGLGKTHLMQSIGNEIYNCQSKKVLYVTSETFLNHFLNALKNNSQPEFKKKYRGVDVLLIDDIHDLENKKETQEELFYTYNALYQEHKQMVFTSDRHVSELKNITERLKNRFTNGLIVDITPPSVETRIAIIKKKLEIDYSDISVPEEVIEFISSNIISNIRDLESALTRLVAYTKLIKRPITLDIAKQQLKMTLTNSKKNYTINDVQKVVSDYFDVSINDLKGKRKTKNYTFPRQISMYIIKKLTDFSTTEIGLEFGGRDHTTVMHSCQKIEDLIKADLSVEPMINNLIRLVKEKRSNE